VRILCGRLARSRDAAGMTLIEVLVAMLIFALVSTGIIYTMLSTLTITRDSRARQVASNLAAQQIDLSRDAKDLFLLVDNDHDVTLNGDTFHVHTSTQWVSDPDLEFSCGAGGGALRYKRVNVTVTWDNMRSVTNPVRSDTVIDPKVRINDPTKGTILVSVLNAVGTGVAGVTVATSPSTGTVIAPTDAQGCTYILKANPGAYTVTVSGTGYRDGNQNATASTSVSVTMGTSSSAGFLYDKAATFTTHLATTFTPGPGVTLRVPTDMKISFWNTYGIYSQTPTGGAGTATQTFPLHPYPSGYQVYAGACDRGEPGFWESVPDVGGTLQGVRGDAVSGPPGGTASVDVPMGIVTIAAGGSGNFLRAERVTIVPADACTEVLHFGSVLGASPTTIALPYGAWKLYRGTSAGAAGSQITAGSISAPVPAVPERTTIAADGTVTLDPRVVVAP